MSAPSPTCVFFACVWPEPWSSAAGLRTRELTSFLQSYGYRVVGLSACVDNRARREWEAAGVETHPCPLNDSTVHELFANLNPELVIYDRFLMEEQYGWRAREQWPSALHLIDTIDLHSLRREREGEKQSSWSTPIHATEASEDRLREMASLYRADGCLVVSDFEAHWLAAQGYPADRACFLPFSAEPAPAIPPRQGRQGACFIGNYRHAPNLDAARWLVDTLWPALRPTFQSLHLYGAYPPELLTQLHGKRGIQVHANVPDHRAALGRHLVSLAPLRFGAGIKGKVLESWAVGTPVLGTAIAFEGKGFSGGPDEFRNEAELLARAKQLVENEDEWAHAQARGLDCLHQNFRAPPLREKFLAYLKMAQERRLHWRGQLVGQMLRHQQHNSTKYFALWIEAKNRI